MSNNTKIWMAQGGAQMNVEPGGIINMKSGAAFAVNGSQPAHIADLATGASAATIVTKVNAVLARLEAVGISATS